MRCAVSNCSQTNAKKSGRRIHYFRFPKYQEQLKGWIAFCRRTNHINTDVERICSLHFNHEDYERNMQFEMGFAKVNIPKLRPGIIPTIRRESDIILREVCENIVPRPELSITDSALHDIANCLLQRIDALEEKIKSLRQENTLSEKANPVFNHD